MKHIIWLMIWLLGFHITPLYATTANNYTVSGINVSETAETATKAREKAILNAQRQALRTFLKRIGSDPRFERDIAAKDLDSMVSTLNIYNEKITNDYYSATINIVFDPNFVRYTLNQLDIKKGVQRADVYLIIPVYIHNGQRKILGEAAYIATLWGDIAKQNGIRNFIKLPLNDPDEESILSNQNLLLSLGSNKEMLLNKYEADKILISEATYNSSSNAKQLSVKILSKDPTRTLTITPEEPGASDYKTFFADSVQKIIDTLEIGTRIAPANLATTSDGERSTIISLKMRDPKDWVILKNKLTESSIIHSYKILTMENDRMSVKLELDPNASQEDVNNEITSFNRSF